MSDIRRLVFAGTPGFAAQHLDALLQAHYPVTAVLTQPDRPSGRGKKNRPSPVKQLALDAGLPVFQPTTLRSDADQAEIRALQPDLLVVVAYGLILPQAVLDIPRMGCLNVHASLLPRWRGAAPIQRAIEAGDRQSGVTIMQMEAGLDTGPMIAQVPLSLGDNETGGGLHDRLAKAGAELLVRVLAELPENLDNAVPQNNEQATYADKILKGESAIDWREPADNLARKIRAFNPSPACFSYLGGQRIKLWQACPAQVPAQTPPGTIVRVDASGILVGCGSGGLNVSAAQLPGAKALPVAELLRGQGRNLFVAGRAFSPAED